MKPPPVNHFNPSKFKNRSWRSPNTPPHHPPWRAPNESGDPTACSSFVNESRKQPNFDLRQWGSSTCLPGPWLALIVMFSIKDIKATVELKRIRRPGETSTWQGAFDWPHPSSPPPADKPAVKTSAILESTSYLSSPKNGSSITQQKQSLRAVGRSHSELDACEGTQIIATSTWSSWHMEAPTFSNEPATARRRTHRATWKQTRMRMQRWPPLASSLKLCFNLVVTHLSILHFLRPFWLFGEPPFWVTLFRYLWCWSLPMSPSHRHQKQPAVPVGVPGCGGIYLIGRNHLLSILVPTQTSWPYNLVDLANSKNLQNKQLFFQVNFIEFNWYSMS